MTEARFLFFKGPSTACCINEITSLSCHDGLISALNNFQLPCYEKREHRRRAIFHVWKMSGPSLSRSRRNVYSQSPQTSSSRRSLSPQPKPRRMKLLSKFSAPPSPVPPIRRPTTAPLPPLPSRINKNQE